MSRRALTRPTVERTSGRLDRHFEITARSSSLRTEILGGLSTFMAMSYIIVLNPAILVEGGFPWRSAFLATALVAGLATIATGVWARLPFAVAPGMEVNALVVSSVVAAYGFGWQEALGLVLCSGVLMLAGLTELFHRFTGALTTPEAIAESLDQALLVGLILHLATGGVRRRRPPPILLLITALLAASVAVQYTIDRKDSDGFRIPP